MQVLSEHEKDPAALASLDRIYESQGMYENLAAILRQRLDDHRRQRRAGHAEPAARARLRRGAGGDRSGDRQLPRGAGARVALARGAGRARAALLPQRALAGAVRRLREAGRRRARTTTGMADCYARMAKLAADALDDREKAVELWGRVVDIRGEDADRARRAWPICTRWPASGSELTEVLEKQVVATPDPEAQHPDLQAPGPHLGREAVARAQLARELAEGPGDRSAGRRRPARHRRQLQERGRLGGAVAGAAPPDPGRPAGRQRHRARRAQGAVLAARRARGRHADAHAGRDRRLARGAGARRGRLPRAGRARAPVHAGGALGGGGRHPRAAREGAGQPERPRRRPDAGGVAVGRQDRRRRLGRRGLRARAADRSGPPAGVGRAGAALSPAQELGEAGRPAAGAHRVLARRGDAHRSCWCRCPRPTSSSSTIATARS